MAAMNMKQGILKNSPSVAQKVGNVDIVDSLTHATTIIGWGVDPNDKTKYWIVRNSYGR